MLFSLEQLERFKRWESIVEGNSRLGDETVDLHIMPIIVRLRQPKNQGIYITRSGGLENFFSFFVSRPRLVPLKDPKFYGTAWNNADCVEVWLSLLAPVGVLFTKPARNTSDNYFSMLDPMETETDIERAVVDAVALSEYRLLSRSVLYEPLPPGIQPHSGFADLYCTYDPEPWDRVIHLLFSETD